MDRGVTSNQVSLFGVGSLAVACLMPPSLALAAAIFILLYVLCDGIDGPLARQSGKVHDGGSLVDIVADQMGVVLLTAAATYHLDAFGPAMVLFSAAYTVFIGLVVYANELDLNMRLFVRSKYPFYALYVVGLYRHSDAVSLFCGLFALYYTVESALVLKKLYDYHASRQAEAD
jgi:phosphatidylglycerophosphate synthase